MNLEGLDLVMLVSGVFIDAFAFFLNTMAFQKSQAGFVSLIGFISVVYAMLADCYIFDQIISVQEVIGAITIFSVTIIVTIFKNKKEREEKKERQETELSENTLP